MSLWSFIKRILFFIYNKLTSFVSHWFEHISLEKCFFEIIYFLRFFLFRATVFRILLERVWLLHFAAWMIVKWSSFFNSKWISLKRYKKVTSFFLMPPKKWLCFSTCQFLIYPWLLTPPDSHVPSNISCLVKGSVCSKQFLCQKFFFITNIFNTPNLP